MSDTRVLPIGKRHVLEAFARLLAPRPRVYVFRSLAGWQFATAEMPDTHQVLLGVSAELWHRIENEVYERTMRRVSDYAEVQYVHEGDTVCLVVPRSPLLSVVEDDFAAVNAEVEEVRLTPKPIARAE